LGGVSAASADISVSGSAEFQYDSWSGSSATSTTANDTNIATTTDFSISASTVTDNGLTLSARTFQDGSGDSLGDSDGSFDENGFSISGDFGKFGFASDEDGDAFATALDITDDEGYNTTASSISSYKPSDEWIASAEVSYKTPTVNGFTASIGIADGDYSDTSVGGVQYAATAGDASVTLKYAFESVGKATSTTAAVDETSLGMVLSMGGATLTIAQQTSEASGNTYDYQASGAAIAYAVSDTLTVEAFSGETTNDGSTDANFKFKETGYGITYTITPGLSLSLTSNTWDQDGTTDEDGTNTAVAIDLSF
jgi:hypothetical protein